MAGWYVGEILTLVVVVPVVLLLLTRLLRPCIAIQRKSEDILSDAATVSGHLVAVPKLIETRALTGAAKELVDRYGAAVAQLLSEMAAS